MIKGHFSHQTTDSNRFISHGREGIRILGAGVWKIQTQRLTWILETTEATEKSNNIITGKWRYAGSLTRDYSVLSLRRLRCRTGLCLKDQAAAMYTNFECAKKQYDAGRIRFHEVYSLAKLGFRWSCFNREVHLFHCQHRHTQAA